VPLIVGEYLREMKRRLEEALAALSTNSLEDLKKVTHAIAGASASVGALRLRQIAKRVELDCIAGGEEQARVLARELPHVMELTDTAFREHLAMVSRALDVTDNVVAA
jgi:HPt (histidine-containing phosphotransfer) domain-containing protein